MKMKIIRAKAEFNSSKHGSDKHVIMIEFPNCYSTTTKKPFRWLPTYKQLSAIYMKLAENERSDWKGGDKNANKK